LYFNNFLSVYFDKYKHLRYSESMKESQSLTIIENSGLSKKGALIYFALLELGGAFPSQIAKHTRLKRSTVYEILDDLAIKGLISELKKRNKYFYAIEHPKRLVHFSQRTIAKAEEQYQKLQEFLPNLEGLYAGIANKPKVSYFEGTDGVMEIYADHISGKEKYEMTGFVNIAELMQFLPEKKYCDYVKLKEKLGITSKAIFPDTQEDRAYEKTAYLSASKKILPKVKFIPKKEFPWKGDITIYADNKVSIIIFDEQKVSGIILESKTIHQMMRMIFELAWKGA